MHNKNIISGVVTVCFVFVKCILYLDEQKQFRTLLFLCELSHQQRNNISGLATKYFMWMLTKNKVLHFLLIQKQNTCRCRIRWEHSLNCMTSCIMAILLEAFLLFIYLCFYAVFVSLWPLYHSDGNILLVLLRQRLILAVSPIFSFTSVSPTVLVLFRPRSFRTRSCSS